ncbi:MAG: HAMP domain-containing histidine kinase [Rhodospirillaceae bacterium]|nr:HAMP domain-containing histidine kinase [Rhodospirillales bacterium]
MKGLIEAIVRSCADLATVGPSKLNAPARYAMAVGLIVLATMVRLAIAPQQAGLPYVTYFPAATLAAILGGLGPAAVSTVLGAVTAAILFIPPFGSVKLDHQAIVSALVFCIDEAVVCSAIEAMRRYYRRFAETAKALEKSYAAEIRARMAAERANEAKSRFLASASHDLRQPYQALRLFHGALENPQLTRQEIAPILAKMDVAMAAGEELLQSLLDLSTLDAGVVTPKPVPVDIGNFMTGLELSYRSVAESKKLDFRMRSMDGTVTIDPVLLRRILDNLISNAIRYTHKGGLLIACRRYGGHTVFEVWDTGLGIAPQHQDVIFEEFYQIGNSERDRTKGMGLGLAVVAKTAQLIGLTVTMQSQLNRGTHFRVSLP